MPESVLRSGRKQGFTVVGNIPVKKLSLKALGLYTVMMSRPDSWEFSVSGLAAYTEVSKDTIRTLLQEMEKAGFLIRQQLHGEKGKFSRNIYVLYDEPQPLPENTDNGENRQRENTDGGETRERENPPTENPTQSNKDLNQERLDIPPISPKRKSVRDISPEICERILKYAPEDQDLQQAILDLLENRRVANKRPVKTMRAMDGILRDLDNLSGGSGSVKLLLLDKAIKCNYLTVYPLKPDEMPRTGPAGGESEDRDGI